MNIKIVGKDLTATEAIKEYVENPIIQGIIENKKEINIDSISDKVLI